jgi:hypothetical protein
VLRCYHYLSVLSNAQHPTRSKISLPNVQGETHLSLPCPQPVVLPPRVCPSANMLTTWLKKAPPVHPILKVFQSFVDGYVIHFIFGCRHHVFFMHSFRNVFNNAYAILKHCYLFHRSSMPCPVLLRVRMQRSFFSCTRLQGANAEIKEKIIFFAYKLPSDGRVQLFPFISAT